MKLVDIDCGGFRLPVKNMDQQQFESFKSEVENLDFAAFRSTN